MSIGKPIDLHLRLQNQNSREGTKVFIGFLRPQSYKGLSFSDEDDQNFELESWRVPKLETKLPVFGEHVFLLYHYRSI